MINFIGLKEQQEILLKKINTRMSNVLEHGKYILGPEVSELEEALSDFVGSKYCVTCSSGTDALLMSLMAKDLGPDDAVIVPSFTYIASAEVVELLGAKTYFCDINPNTFNIETGNLEDICKKISKDDKNLKGLIAVDIFGLPARYRLLEEFAIDKSIFLIQDMAQSFGSSIRGKKSGTFGDLGATSFFPSKPLGCYGDGGAIFTNDPELAELLRSIRVHGAGENKYDNVRIGINGRLDTLQAAILLEKLKIFSAEFSTRQDIASYYKEHLDSSIITQYLPTDYLSGNALFPIILSDTGHRDRIIKALSDNKIPSMIYYPKPLNKQVTFLQNRNMPSQPVSESLSNKILSIPFHPYLSQKDLDQIINVISDVR